MKTVDIEDARKQLSKLVARAAKGETFVISRARKPLVKVMALDAPPPKPLQRLGFLSGRIKVPDDFDRMGETEFAHLFGVEGSRGSTRR